MKFNILTSVILLFAAQVELVRSNPEPWIPFSDIANNIESSIETAKTTINNAIKSIESSTGVTAASPESTTAPVAAATNTVPTAADGIIQLVIDKTKEFESASYAGLANSIYEKLDTDTDTSFNHIITIAGQIISNAATVELANAANVSQTLINIVNDILENGEGTLNDKIEQIIQAIHNLSDKLVNTKLALIIGSTLTDIINKCLATVGAALATDIRVKKIGDLVTALSKIAVLNNLVDTILKLSGTALDKIPTPTDVLTKIQNILLANGAELTKAYDGVENVSNVKITVTEAVNTTVNDIITALSDSAAELAKVINALEDTHGGIVIATKSAFEQIALILIEAAFGTDSVVSKIIGEIGNTAAEIIEAAKLAFPNLASLLDTLNANTGESIANKFWPCISTENENFQKYHDAFLAQSVQLQAELGSGNISVSSLVDTIRLVSNQSISYEATKFRLSVCETAQAASTANVILPAVAVAVSVLV